MKEETLYKVIDDQFNRIPKYRRNQRHNRHYFISAHFETPYFDELTHKEQLKLRMLLKNYLKPLNGHKCCDKHNKNYTRDRNQRNKRQVWQKILRQRMKDGLEICKKCGTKENLTLDEIIPISKGGKRNQENTQVLCLPCNMEKADK